MLNFDYTWEPVFHEQKCPVRLVLVAIHDTSQEFGRVCVCVPDGPNPATETTSCIDNNYPGKCLANRKSGLSALILAGVVGIFGILGSLHNPINVDLNASLDQCQVLPQNANTPTRSLKALQDPIVASSKMQLEQF